MTDTPTSNTSTLWHDRDVRDSVAVAQAENDFGQVQRSLEPPKVSADVTIRDSSPDDLEKGHDGDRQETFDLREYLTSSNDANSAAGIKHKHVGVTWEDLEVSGIGGGDNKVCRYMQCFLRSLSHHPRSPDVCFHICRSVFRAAFTSKFLNSWADAITGLVTFPFVVLHNLLQPILPKKLTQGPPLRNIIHRCASHFEGIFVAF